MPVPGLSGWTASLRQHWLAMILVTLGVVLRLMAQFAYRPALFYIDSVKYLYDSQGNDPEGYKGPLRRSSRSRTSTPSRPCST